MSWWTPVLTISKAIFRVDLGSSAAVKKFEDCLGSIFKKTAICLPNARYCLKITLDHLNIDENSNVLMTPINLPDMETIIVNTGASLQFVDFKEKSFEPDIDSFVPAENTKVFFVTPLAGIPVDLDKISAYCENYKIKLVLDLTQCYQTEWKGRKIYEFSDYAFSSLCDLKVIHTHRGAYYITDNDSLEHYIREKSKSDLNSIKVKFLLLSAFEDWVSLTLLNPYVFYFFTRFLLKILVTLRGDNVEAITSGQGVKFLGFRFLKGFFQSNQIARKDGFPSFLLYRFTDLQAKIGLERLPGLGEIEEKRIKNANRFFQALSEKAKSCIPKEIDFESATFWKSPIWIENPEDFKKRAAKFGIDCSQTNLPQLNNVKVGSTRNMRDNVVYMPTHWYLLEEEVDFLANFVNNYFQGK